MDTPKPLSTQDERVIAALSHVTSLFPMMGIIAPIIIWVTQRERSKFVAFQSLQALAYQISMLLFFIIGMACYTVSFFGTFFTIPLAATAENNSAMPVLFFIFFAIPFIVMGVLFVSHFILTLYGVVGAVMALGGKDFRYLVIGRMVERYMNQPEKKEEIS